MGGGGNTILKNINVKTKYDVLGGGGNTSKVNCMLVEYCIN